MCRMSEMISTNKVYINGFFTESEKNDFQKKKVERIELVEARRRATFCTKSHIRFKFSTQNSVCIPAVAARPTKANLL